MYKQTIKFLGAMVLTLSSMAAVAQSDNPFLGTWDLDFVQSDFGSAPVPKAMSRTYADLGYGNYMYLVVSINQDDTLGGTSAVYTYSGQGYPIASLDEVGAAIISYNRINDQTVEYTIRVGGEVSSIGAKFISPSHQQLTIGIQYPNSDQEDQLLVFNRRR